MITTASLYLIGATATSIAGPVARGTFGIEPVRHDVVARPPVTLEPTKVDNTTPVAYSVSVVPAIIHQGRDGAPIVSDAPKELRAARRILSVEPRRFALGAGQVQSLNLRWKSLPPGARAAYIALAVTGTPHTRTRGSTPVINRVVGINLLRLPGRQDVTGGATGMWAEQGPKRSLVFVTLVRNSGSIDSRPRRPRLRVFDARHRLVARVSWPSGTILPGAAREFPAVLRRRLSAGHYAAISALTFGHRRTTARTSFELVGRNQLPTPKLELMAIQAWGERGGSATVRALVVNIGNTPVAPRVDATLSGQARNGSKRDRPISKTVKASSMRPGGRRIIGLELGSNLRGRVLYRAVVTLGDGRRTFQRRMTTFVPTSGSGFPVVWAIMGLALLLAAGAASRQLWLRFRRRRPGD